jgi:proteasome assembly chaperone (PAC2) family protein
MKQATLLLALTGWMDGGMVSSGTIKHLMDGRTLTRVGRIEPGGFYIDNFPGPMEVAALFRPHVKYENGMVTSFESASNEFYADPAENMAFFLGKEPNLNWPRFGDCLFEVCLRLGVKRIIFMGSFGGTVPHTREPRMYGSVSGSDLLPLLKQHDLKPSDYEGPGSFATYLLIEAPKHEIEMLSISVEIPGYLEGLNPLSIEAVARRLARILDVSVNVDKLRKASNSWEQQVTEAVQKDDNLAATVRKLEEKYDNELIGVKVEDEEDDDDDDDDEDED